MPGWAGSSWYFYRYMDSKNEENFADSKIISYWKDVDLYVGGSERIKSFQRLGVSRMYFQVLDEDDLDQVSLLAELLGEFSGTRNND